MNYTAQPFHNAEAFKLFNDAVMAAADYSSKIAARQFDFARKIADQNNGWQNNLSAPDSAEVKKSVSDYLDFVRETVEDIAQASDRHFAWVESVIDGAVKDGKPFLTPQAEALGQQWVSGVKAANAALQDGVRASCRATVDGINVAHNGDEEIAEIARAKKSAKK